MDELSGTRYFVVGPTGHLVEARNFRYDDYNDRIILEVDWGDSDAETVDEEK